MVEGEKLVGEADLGVGFARSAGCGTGAGMCDVAGNGGEAVLLGAHARERNVHHRRNRHPDPAPCKCAFTSIPSVAHPAYQRINPVVRF
jgi:hypothetical protein